MTPTRLEHLRAIDAHLTALLDLAAKRTPGEWFTQFIDIPDIDKWPERVYASDASELSTICTFEDRSDYNQFSNANAAFIADCAGNAEAGWWSTKAAIGVIYAMHAAIIHAEKNNKRGFVTESLDVAIEALITPILAAWPIEKLKLP